MRSSLDKHRDMARSILPSKHRRQAAKAKGVVKRRARYEIRQQLRVLQVHDLSTIDDWDASFNCRAWPDAKISSLVARRRQADKLNHFERWAIAITATLPIEERLGHMAAILPKGLIGDHAISHLVRLPEFDPRPLLGNAMAAALCRDRTTASTSASAPRARRGAHARVRVPPRVKCRDQDLRRPVSHRPDRPR